MRRVTKKKKMQAREVEANEEGKQEKQHLMKNRLRQENGKKVVAV